MQELHCRPLFQADPLIERVEPICQKQSVKEFDNKNFETQIHKKNPNHDSTKLWPEIKRDEVLELNNIDLFKSIKSKLDKKKMMIILGILTMGFVFILSVIKSFFLQIYPDDN
jgi:hypothetical protein